MIFDPFGDDFFKDLFGEMFNISRPKIGEEHTTPLTETLIIGKELIVLVELPGAKKESIKIELRGNMLRIKATADFYHASQPKEYVQNIQLPVKVDKKYSKTFHNGILELKFKIKGWLPKPRAVEEEESDIIPIK
ncbi:MAG: Hsp20/alpha crystallin family protein [Candidatus Diapherotrites archaeon]|nr:Hsp20/alpha crystallin family protein [Candidatus Diapherotrites archaeon]